MNEEYICPDITENTIPEDVDTQPVPQPQPEKTQIDMNSITNFIKSNIFFIIILIVLIFMLQ